MTSDDATTLASELCLTCFYPRFADFVRSAIVHCTLDAEPLSDEQCECLYRAVFEAADGTREQVAHAIDFHTVKQFRRSLETPDD